MNSDAAFPIRPPFVIYPIFAYTNYQITSSYVILFGAGTYDYKNKAGTGFGNMRHYNNWQRIVESIDTADLPQVLELLERVGAKNVRDELRGSLLASLAETDPGAAMAHANTVAGKPSREMAVMQVMQTWSERDPAAATAWVQQLPAGPLRNQALNVAAGTLAATDPQEAFDLIKTNLSNQCDSGGMYQVISTWAEKDRRRRPGRLNHFADGSARRQFRLLL